MEEPQSPEFAEEQLSAKTDENGQIPSISAPSSQEITHLNSLSSGSYAPAGTADKTPNRAAPFGQTSPFNLRL